MNRWSRGLPDPFFGRKRSSSRPSPEENTIVAPYAPTRVQEVDGPSYPLPLPLPVRSQPTLWTTLLPRKRNLPSRNPREQRGPGAELRREGERERVREGGK